ncbi:RNA-binding domain-containing protein [Leucogyrophana mollusca]|uniref:RNA-binding domain-containing protein n=1 Tax=Leucogyrophana mollusca TaxID=85980 RepID=A0ACB8BMZ3_9AGAM|nr:RNA-binding domain-containing protein [Leucogyrophana mollusca]
MDDAWQSQDIAPSGISIPSHDANMNGGNAPGDEPSWNNGGRSPVRDRGGDPPRRSSRSRSPGARDADRGRGGGGGGEGGGGHNPGNNLHVSSLSHRVDTRDLEQAFAKIGRVKKASVMYDPHTRESRGFGFVTMETAEEADAAITALNATELMGKTMAVEKARRGRARTPTPGRYYGPPKRGDNERPYDPRPYDSRYSRDYDDRRPPRGGRYDDHRGGGGGGRDYDRGGYRDYDRGYGGGGGGRDYDRGRYDDRRY